MIRIRQFTDAALAVLAFVAATAVAQDYPSRPITLLVPFAAGGPTDIVARSLGQSMGKALQQTIAYFKTSDSVAPARATVAPFRPVHQLPAVARAAAPAAFVDYTHF